MTRISKKHLLLRAILSGVFTIVLGMAVALCHPSFSAVDIALFGAILLYVGEIALVHTVLWLLFKKRTKERFLHKNIVQSEGIGAVIFVFSLGVIFNDDYDLLFLSIIGIVWVGIGFLWNVLDDQDKENKESRSKQTRKQPKKKKK